MIDVIVWVTRVVVDAAAPVVPEPVRVVPVEPPPVRPVPPRGAVGADVSGGGAVVVVGSQGTIVDVDEGTVAASVVGVASDVGVVDVVDVEVVVDSGDDPGGAESTGVVGVVVVVAAGGGAGVLGAVQSSNAALAVAGTDDATVPVEPVDRADVLGVLAATVLELV